MKTWKPGRPFDFDKYHMRHIALKFLYLGWDYQGFVVQEYNKVDKTIENALFKALTTTKLINSREESNYHRCGRTDIGVSAFSQVISITVRSKSLKTEELCSPNRELNYPFLLNRALPSDIQCISWSPIKQSFSARFDCSRRSYRYFFPRSNLNIEKMKEAAEYLVGQHDFKNFCKQDVSKNVQKSTVKKVLSASIFPADHSTFGRSISESLTFSNNPYDIMIFEISAHGFLWHQIRCIMAVLFLVGEGKEKENVVSDLLDLRKTPNKPQYQLSSGLPLVLYQCDYNKDDVNEWIGDEAALTEVIENLQTKWTALSIKSNIIHSMITSLVRDYSCLYLDTINKQHNSLSFENSKNHKLLSERPVCKKKDKN
jgi:tRNA pseudouridine38/39 synthase